MGGWRDEAEARRLEEVEDPQVLKRKYKSQIRSSVYDKEPNASLKSIVVVSAAIGCGLWVLREGKKLDSAPLEPLKRFIRRFVGGTVGEKTASRRHWKDMRPSDMAAAAAAARQQSSGEPAGSRGGGTAGKKKEEEEKEEVSLVFQNVCVYT
eukprot:jgi/Picre1/35514/NNA_002975.t1